MVTESFAPLPSEIGAARQFALAASEDWGCDPQDLGLVVSELATNACVHAHSPFTVSLDRLGSQVFVEVADADPTPPRVVPPSNGVSGRGMHIVASIAREWGTTGRHPGKAIWAILDCYPAASAPVDRVGSGS
jgi:anti-sigma regulatory factor (Ser/Thr protein kinase)